MSLFLAEFTRVPTPFGQLVVTGKHDSIKLLRIGYKFVENLRTKRPARYEIMPYTYAGPTAGNAAFASFYTGLFKSSYRYYNAIDIVPKAWAELLSIKNLYSSPGPACPWELKDTIDLVSVWLNAIKVGYTQPNGAGESLPGVSSSASDFFAEALDQHDHNYYLKLLGAPTVPIAVPHTPANSKKRLHHV